MTSSRSRGALLACALGLFVLGAGYQIKGNVGLVIGGSHGDAVDLRGRELEHAFFVNGANPFDHMTASQPPWGYPFGLLLTWPQWPYTRWYFAALNAAALAFLVCWAYRTPRDVSREGRLLLAASVFAFGGSCTATQVGQVGIIVSALLAAALWADRAGRPWLCGLLIGLSLIKPTISAPFAAALLIAGRYRATAAAAIYVAAASTATWVLTGASPVRMLLQMATSAASYVGDGTLGLIDMLAAWGLVSSAQVALTPLIIGVPAVVLMAFWRKSLVLVFAVAAVSGRLWTYHKFYDDVMMVFLMVPLGVVALKTRSRSAMAAFVLLGLVSWVPGRVLAIQAFQMVQLAVWLSALVCLLVASRQPAAATERAAESRSLETAHAS